MELYQEMPIDLQEYVNKVYHKKIVMKEMMDKYEEPKMCLNCIFHGLPCLNCAYEEKGKRGPGYYMGDRIMFSKENEEDEETHLNMLCYILMKNPNVRIVESITSEELNIPQYEEYMNNYLGDV